MFVLWRLDDHILACEVANAVATQELKGLGLTHQTLPQVFRYYQLWVLQENAFL